MRNDDEFAFFYPNVLLTLRLFTHLHEETSFDHEKEFILLVMVMPDKLSFDFDNLNRKLIQFSNYLRVLVVGEESKFLHQIDLFHEYHPFTMK